MHLLRIFFVFFNFIYLCMDDKSGLLIFLQPLFFTGEKKIILWVSLLPLGIVKQALWILCSILLILAYSRERIIHFRFESGCMSFTSNCTLYNYFWTYCILSFGISVICIWKPESSWTAVTFSWQHYRECHQHDLCRIHFSLS